MATNRPHHDDARPESEHSPPLDRGRRSWKIGVTIGYGIAYFALLTYAMARDKDVLLAFLAGAALSLVLILVVWHPEYIKSLRIRVRLYKVRLLTSLETRRRTRGVQAAVQTQGQKSAGADPDAILDRTEQIAARTDEQKSKKKNVNSAIRKGQKRKASL